MNKIYIYIRFSNQVVIIIQMNCGEKSDYRDTFKYKYIKCIKYKLKINTLKILFSFMWRVLGNSFLYVACQFL